MSRPLRGPIGGQFPFSLKPDLTLFASAIAGRAGKLSS